MPDFRQLHDEDIHALYAELASQYEIPALNRDDPSIKYGLRNADGTGVIAGVSNIGSVQGYYMEDGVRQPMPGKLYYRGISVEDIVEAHQKAGTFGYEEVAYLLLIGHLPTRGSAAEVQSPARAGALSARALSGGQRPAQPEQQRHEPARPLRHGSLCL